MRHIQGQWQQVKQKLQHPWKASMTFSEQVENAAFWCRFAMRQSGWHSDIVQSELQQNASRPWSGRWPKTNFGEFDQLDVDKYKPLTTFRTLTFSTTVNIFLVGDSDIKQSQSSNQAGCIKDGLEGCLQHRHRHRVTNLMTSRCYGYCSRFPGHITRLKPLQSTHLSCSHTPMGLEKVSYVILTTQS